MRRAVRFLVVLTLAAVAVPLVPFVVCGARLDQMVAGWLDPPPPAAVLAALEVGVLAADMLLPVPSSLVATLGGAQLGFVVGTACAWLGMTVGAAAGWWLGRAAAAPRLAGLAAEERAELDRRQRRYGPLAVVLTRPVPLVAEAAALVAGGSGMPFREFLAAAGGGNLAIAAAWTLAGVLGRQAESLQWVLVASLAVPVAIASLATRRGLQSPSRRL